MERGLGLEQPYPICNDRRPSSLQEKRLDHHAQLIESISTVVGRFFLDEGLPKQFALMGVLLNW